MKNSRKPLGNSDRTNRTSSKSVSSKRGSKFGRKKSKNLKNMLEGSENIDPEFKLDTKSFRKSMRFSIKEMTDQIIEISSTDTKKDFTSKMNDFGFPGEDFSNLD